MDGFASGQQPPSQRMARLLDHALGAGGQLTAAARRGQLDSGESGTDALDEEIAALELARRAAASDVGAATVERLELVVDSLAIAYPARRRPGSCSRRAATSATSPRCWTHARPWPSGAGC